jgi:hypothetical protein
MARKFSELAEISGNKCKNDRDKYIEIKNRKINVKKESALEVKKDFRNLL